MNTERKRQEKTAFMKCEYVYRWHFLIDGGKETFSAIAPSESGALRVLNAEKPGIHAKFDGCTSVPCKPLSMRVFV